MPAHIQPFKQDARVTGDEERVEMLRLATDGNEKFEVTDVELSRGGVSYTIDSLRRLRDGYAPSPGGKGACAESENEGVCSAGVGSTGDSKAAWFFIMGADMFLSLDKWREHENLMKEFAFIVGLRPGYRAERAEAAARRYADEYGTEVLIVADALPDISSTEIRRRAAACESLRDMTPDAVAAYLGGRGLYRSGLDRRPLPER
jgi:nicotinate-nucleotide adenylyltransferase